MTASRPPTPSDNAVPLAPGRVHHFERDAMACTFGIDIIAADARYAEQAAWAAFEEIDRLEQLLSRFIPHSEIAQLNALQPGQTLRVSTETIECLQLASRLYAETNGTFDITFRSRSARPESTTATLAPLVLDPANHTVGVQIPGVIFDLGALGKGYAVDRAVAILREWRIDAALVHSGQSSVYALGQPAAGTEWHLHLRDPDDQNTVLGSLLLSNGALSGSGQRLHGGHIIDPRTGKPAIAATAAWAIAPTGAVSDALSTAFMIMPSRAVEALCGRYDDVTAILLHAPTAPGELLCFGAHCNALRRGGGPA